MELPYTLIVWEASPHTSKPETASTLPLHLELLCFAVCEGSIGVVRCSLKLAEPTAREGVRVYSCNRR